MANEGRESLCSVISWAGDSEIPAPWEEATPHSSSQLIIADGNIPKWEWEPRSRRGRGLGFEEEFAAEVQREDEFSRKKALKYAKRRVERVWGGREGRCGQRSVGLENRRGIYRGGAEGRGGRLGVEVQGVVDSDPPSP